MEIFQFFWNKRLLLAACGNIFHFFKLIWKKIFKNLQLFFKCELCVCLLSTGTWHWYVLFAWFSHTFTSYPQKGIIAFNYLIWAQYLSASRAFQKSSWLRVRAPAFWKIAPTPTFFAFNNTVDCFWLCIVIKIGGRGETTVGKDTY